MIGIDTNVLLRFYERDNPPQYESAGRAIRDHAAVFVNELVLLEFVWVCQSTYRLDRAEIHRRLKAVVDAAEFEFARRESIERAIDVYGARKSDFADCLIGEINRHHGCETTLTFDESAAKADGRFSVLR